MSTQDTPYFSYGSNCFVPQLRARCPGAAKIGPATADGYALGWTTRSDGATRSTIRRQEGARTRGVLFRGVSPDEMDPYEGEGRAYILIRVTVEGVRGPVEAFTYVAFEDGLRAWEGAPAARDIPYALKVVGGRASHGLATPGANIVVVYGSLMEGFANHHVLRGELTAKINDVTLRGLRLVDLGAFPGAVPGGDGDCIQGEAWLVDDETLAGVDELEGHPRFYRRTPWKVGGWRVETYILQRRADRYTEVPGGDWREWASQGA